MTEASTAQQLPSKKETKERHRSIDAEMQAADAHAKSNHHHHLSAEEKQVFYEDRFVRVSDGGIRVFHYFFPTARSKFVTWEKLHGFHTDQELGLGFGDYKGWGMGLSPIWWAIGMEGGRPLAGLTAGRPQLLLKTKSWVQIGCSVDDMDKCLAVIRKNFTPH